MRGAAGRATPDAPGKGDEGARLTVLRDASRQWRVVFAGITPVPVKVITLTPGWTGRPPDVFIAASIIARAIRLLALAARLWNHGAPAATASDGTRAGC